MADERQEPPLSDEELKAMREMIKQDERARWVWSSIRLWSMWLAATVGGLTLTYDTIIRAIRSAVGK